MRYFATASGPKVRAAMTAGLIDLIVAPGRSNRYVPGVPWCADNGCFTTAYPGDDKWWAWLSGRAADLEAAAICAFAVAPDVVGDAAATLARSAPWLPRIRALGLPAAFVAQDGLEDLDVPWETFDVLFIGGSTEWKLSEAAAGLVRQAKARGKGTHMGRVNSGRRFRYAASIGCDSVDGTYLVFGPDVNLPSLLRWVRHDRDHQPLFGAAPW